MVAEYRGYKIELRHEGGTWHVTIHPTRQIFQS